MSPPSPISAELIITTAGVTLWSGGIQGLEPTLFPYHPIWVISVTVLVQKNLMSSMITIGLIAPYSGIKAER